MKWWGTRQQSGWPVAGPPLPGEPVAAVTSRNVAATVRRDLATEPARFEPPAAQAAGLLGWLQGSGGRVGWMWVFGTVALVFNPLVPLRLGRGTWSVVDVVAALILLTSILPLRTSSSESTRTIRP